MVNVDDVRDPKVIFEKMLGIEKLTGGFIPPNPRRLNRWTMYML